MKPKQYQNGQNIPQSPVRSDKQGGVNVPKAPSPQKPQPSKPTPKK